MAMRGTTPRSIRFVMAFLEPNRLLLLSNRLLLVSYGSLIQLEVLALRVPDLLEDLNDSFVVHDDS